MTGFDRKKWRRIGTRALDIGSTIVLAVFGCVVVWVLLLFTTYDTFRTPTESMTPTLLPGDRGYINKWKLGGRVFDIYAAAEGRPYEVRRLPGYGRLERGDVIVFNAPFIEKWDSVAMNMYLYYCKRAVAVAGDTLEVVDGFYRVRGEDRVFGVAREQELMNRVVKELAEGNQTTVEATMGLPRWATVAPRDSLFGWTIREMGPYVIPGKGMRMRIDRANFLLYRKYVEWETGMRLEWRDGAAWQGGRRLPEYEFSEDYCFAAGDHVIDSQDSRYWGLVPEKFIVGVAEFVWKSRKGIRWL